MGWEVAYVVCDWCWKGGIWGVSWLVVNICRKWSGWEKGSIGKKWVLDVVACSCWLGFRIVCMRNKVLKLIACSKVSWDFLRYVVNSRESNVCSESFAFSQYLDVPFMFGIKLRRASANRVLLYCPLSYRFSSSISPILYVFEQNQTGIKVHPLLFLVLCPQPIKYNLLFLKS